MIATLLAIAAAGAPVPADAHGIATRISSWGPRPAASRGQARAQRLIGRGPQLEMRVAMPWASAGTGAPAAAIARRVAIN